MPCGFNYNVYMKQLLDDTEQKQNRLDLNCFRGIDFDAGAREGIEPGVDGGARFGLIRQIAGETLPATIRNSQVSERKKERYQSDQ